MESKIAPSTNSDQPGIPIYEDRIPHATGHSIPLLFPADKSPSASYSESYQKVPEISYSISAIFPANTSETNSPHSDHGNSFSHSIQSYFPAYRSTSERSEESSSCSRFAECEEPSSTYEYDFSPTTVGLSGGVHIASGAALGAVFGESFAILHDTVKEVGSKALMFKPVLKRLESTLVCLAPIVNEMSRLSKEFDHLEEETESLIEKMMKGAKLVRKCSKIRWWNYTFKVYYFDKLNELDEAILRFFQVDLQVQNTRNGLETLQVLQNRIGLLPTILETGGLSGVTFAVSCPVIRAPEFIVGLDIPLKELKTLLLKEVQLLQLTAPGGCGKTTG